MAIGRRVAPVLRWGAMWGSVMLAVLLASLWIGSGWFRLSWWRAPPSRITLVDVCQGRLELSGFGPMNGAKKAFYFGPASPKASNRPRFRYWFTWERSPPVWRLWVPLWAPLAACAAVPLGGVLFVRIRARKRLRLGHCLNCGYDLKGLPTGPRCPECGELFTGGHTPAAAQI